MDTQEALDNLWIKLRTWNGPKTIHSFPPQLPLVDTGGFTTHKTTIISDLPIFSLKSEPTITTML